MKSSKYPNLYKYPKRSKHWLYRRYSPEKDKDFSWSTGEDKNEKVANDLGQAEFFKWLGTEATPEALEGGVVYFGDFAQAHLERKLARPLADFAKNSRYTSKSCTRHLIEAFGHLPLDRVTEDRWEDYCNRLSVDGEPPKFFNRRKELKEILLRAHRNGLIKRLPEFRNPDSATNAGRYLEDWEVAALVAASSSECALFLELLWRQGPRPREALQYEWSMINWREGEFGVISIPARITKTRRARTIPLHSVIAGKLRERQKSSKSIYVFPSPDTQKGKDFHMVEYRHAWEGALERAQKLAREVTPKPKEITHCVIYDLRRTFVTNCAKRGKPILWVAKYIDSSTTMLEKFYAKTQHEALQGVIE